MYIVDVLEILTFWCLDLLISANSVQFWQLTEIRQFDREKARKSITPSFLPRMVAIEVQRGWGGRTWRAGGGCGRAKHRPAMGRSHLPLFTKVEGGLAWFQPSFYFKRLIRMVWWPPWPGSPSPLLICHCLLPRSSNLSLHFGWTWRETAMPSRMWMQLRWEAILLLLHPFYNCETRLTLLADCGWSTLAKRLPFLALTGSALQKSLSST